MPEVRARSQRADDALAAFDAALALIHASAPTCRASGCTQLWAATLRTAASLAQLCLYITHPALANDGCCITRPGSRAEPQDALARWQDVYGDVVPGVHAAAGGAGAKAAPPPAISGVSKLSNSFVPSSPANRRSTMGRKPSFAFVFHSSILRVSHGKRIFLLSKNSFHRRLPALDLRPEIPRCRARIALPQVLLQNVRRYAPLRSPRSLTRAA